MTEILSFIYDLNDCVEKYVNSVNLGTSAKYMKDEVANGIEMLYVKCKDKNTLKNMQNIHNEIMLYVKSGTRQKMKKKMGVDKELEKFDEYLENIFEKLKTDLFKKMNDEEIFEKIEENVIFQKFFIAVKIIGMIMARRVYYYGEGNYYRDDKGNVRKNAMVERQYKIFSLIVELHNHHRKPTKIEMFEFMRIDPVTGDKKFRILMNNVSKPSVPYEFKSEIKDDNDLYDYICFVLWVTKGVDVPLYLKEEKARLEKDGKTFNIDENSFSYDYLVYNDAGNKDARIKGVTLNKNEIVKLIHRRK